MLKWAKRLLLLVVLVIALVLGVTFTAENSQPVSPLLLSYPLWSMALGLWLLIFLLSGAVAGLLLSFIPWLWGRQSIASKSKKIKQLEQELTKLRSIGIKE